MLCAREGTSLFHCGVVRQRRSNKEGGSVVVPRERAREVNGDVEKSVMQR